NIDNNEIKKDIMSSKEKAKKLIDKAGLIIENYKADKKAQIEKNVNIDSKVNEEKLSSLIKDIDDIKEELKNINLEELDEKDKKEITDLIIALESLEEIAISYQNDDDNVEKLSDIFELVEVEDNSIEETSKKSQDNNIEKIDAKIEENNNEIVNDSAETFISNDDNNIADKREMRLQEAKENNNSNLNNTISNEKGSELTIINMKDSSSSLKGYNHYNNVSKTQNTNSLAENMIRFQDLMSKLVEKAQVAVNNGKSEVLMSLNPEYLGKVRLKISMDADNNLVGKIFVDNAEIKDIFTKNLDTVISSLNEIGINIEGFDVMLRQDMPNENGEFEFGGRNNNLNGFGADNIEEEVVSVQNYNIVPERKLNLLI
ncbi:flagellar hook-length control protein FliK, partial [uncultured Brachyspira sp.]|uniref:flagellar hook-length control protein FliK n=1 Tax=uncultured Brachyspira sp. TaxID=221953 RepID=UPI0025977A0E